jgi:hypothetical protein
MYTIDKMADASYNWLQALPLPPPPAHAAHAPQVSAGGRHSCGIKTGPGFSDGKDYTGRLFCFGRNVEQQCLVPADVKDAVWAIVTAGHPIDTTEMLFENNGTCAAGWKTTCGVTEVLDSQPHY